MLLSSADRDVSYCDICVCTFGAQEELSIHIERIYKDDEFWNNCITKTKIFIINCLLPELLGNWYTCHVVTSL